MIFLVKKTTSIFLLKIPIILIYNGLKFKIYLITCQFFRYGELVKII